MSVTLRRDEKGDLYVGAGWIHEAVVAAVEEAKKTHKKETLVFNDLRLEVTGDSDVGEVCREYNQRHEARRLELETKKNRETILGWEYAQRDARAALIKKLGLNVEQSRLLAQEIREAFGNATEITEGMHRIMRLGVEIEQ